MKLKKLLESEDMEIDVFMAIFSHLSDIQEQVNSKISGEINFIKALISLMKKGKKEMKESEMNTLYKKWVHRDLTESKEDEIIKDFFAEKNWLAKAIKGMPVNSKTEPILNLLQDLAKQKGYLSEPMIANKLTQAQMNYLKQWS